MLKSGWCQSLTSSLLVAIFVLCLIALVVWVAIDMVISKARWIIGGIGKLMTPMIDYMLGIYSLIKTGTEEAKIKLEKLTSDVTEAISNIIKNVNKEELYKKLQEKIKFYETKSIEELKKINKEISNLITKNEQSSEIIENLLNDMDSFMLNLSSQVGVSEVYSKAKHMVESMFATLGLQMQ